jgi:putative tryptophan/tyrosine transport system substrate-binding protein
MTRIVAVVMLPVAVLAAPLAVEAQPGSKVYRIAIVVSSLPVAKMTSDPANRAFFDELRRLGFVEGQNLVVERRSALGHPERYAEIAPEVVRLIISRTLSWWATTALPGPSRR